MEHTPIGELWIADYSNKGKFMERVREPEHLFVERASFLEPWQGPLSRALAKFGELTITNANRDWFVKVWLRPDGTVATSRLSK